MPEKDLKILLRNMTPVLDSSAYVFCSVDASTFSTLNVVPRASFVEAEGITIVLTEQQAEALGISYSSTWTMITCKIQSDLMSCGFLASIAKVLADANIPMNPMSAFYHDHLFVPRDRAEEALVLLHKLSQNVD